MKLTSLIKHLTAKRNLYCFLILFLIALTVFYPSLDFDLLEQDWVEIERIIIKFGSGFLPFKIPAYYYLTEYGTLWGSTTLIFHLFGSNALLYRTFNLIMRVLAAYALFRLVSYWSARQLFGIASALFFLLTYAGLENTYWAIQYFAYLSTILLCWSLYSWKKYHNLYPHINFRKPFLIFLIAVLIGHIRIFMLPFILLLGEIYQHFIKQDSRFKPNIIHIIYILFFTLVILIGTKLYQGIQGAKMIHPYPLIHSLFTGNYPVLDTFFLFISNVIIPYTVIDFFLPDPQYRNVLVILVLSIVLSITGFLFLLINLVNKRTMITVASLIAVVYPLSIYFAIPFLTRWSFSWITATLLGGQIFIIIFLTSIIFWKIYRPYTELVVLGGIITITHLALSWSMYPQQSSDTSSLYDITSRYYTVPSMGISIMLGFIFSISYEGFKTIFVNHKITRPVLVGTVIIIALYFHSLFNILAINKFLKEFRNRLPDISRREQLWNITKPFFSRLGYKKFEKIIYFEGYRNEKDMLIIKSYLPYLLAVELGHFSPGLSNNTIFILDKNEILSIIRGKQITYNKNLQLKDSFDEKRFFAIKIDEQNHLINIKNRILNEATQKDSF